MHYLLSFILVNLLLLTNCSIISVNQDGIDEKEQEFNFANSTSSETFEEPTFSNNSSESVVFPSSMDSEKNSSTEFNIIENVESPISVEEVVIQTTPKSVPEEEEEEIVAQSTTTEMPQTTTLMPSTTTEPTSTPSTEPPKIDEAALIKEKAMEKLMKIFGLPDSFAKDSHGPGPAPEFMLDLYNTVTDTNGVTRAKSLPYNSQIVRSFLERDNSQIDYFSFNISGLDKSESILAAELHAHRQRISHDELHPSLYYTPFYILSLYQVIDPQRLEIPDLHKLLGVHYVSALGSGWEVFNVKQAVMEWLSGKPNHGFLLVGTSLSGERVPVRFSRRGETILSKQPILVLFNEDTDIKAHLDKGQVIRRPTPTSATNETDPEMDIPPVPTSSLENPQFHHALLYQDSIRHPNSVSRFRSRRSKNHTDMDFKSQEYSECGRRDLTVSFESIGWASWIISPKGYNAFYCDGPCTFPLGQHNSPSNHATVQSIIHELNLSPGVKTPCCTPTKLLPISLLYYDDSDNVVLKQYADMIIESCGCH